MTIDIEKYKVQKIKNKTYYQGKNIMILNIAHKDGSNIKRKDMKKVCAQLQKDLQAIHGMGYISVSIEYPNRWFSSNVSTLNEQINYFSANDYNEFDDDPEQYRQFRFQFIPASLDAGGADPNNDCLITCIKSCVQSNKKCLDAEEIKTFLGLERKDKIPISMMEKVEAHICSLVNMEYAIFVSGDHEYVSKSKSNKKINIVLSKEHYSINKEYVIKAKRRAFEEKPIMMIDFVDGAMISYNGEEVRAMEREEYNALENNPITADYIVVNKKFCVKTKPMCIEDAYETYLEMATEMKEKSKGKFNFFKCGSIKFMALNYFYSLTTTVQPDSITNTEAEWIEKASYSALTYYEKYQGTVYCYDINSRYPSVMVRNFNYFPIKEGEYKVIDVIKEKPDYGIYHCIIKGEIKPFFKFNDKNHYTTEDILVAREYGFDIQLVQDGRPNHLYYSKDKLMNGAFLFKRYVEELYAMKKGKVKGAKDMLNVLWGALCETNNYKYWADSDFELNIDDSKITKFSSDNNCINVSCIPYKKNYYKTNWARIKPFVLSYARSAMYFRYRKYESLVVRLHTDGFYLKENPDDLILGDGLGHLKYEGEKKIIVVSLNKSVKL